MQSVKLRNGMVTCLNNLTLLLIKLCTGCLEVLGNINIQKQIKGEKSRINVEATINGTSTR